jgi:nicotinate-nucleotide pyrophosphorylase (carboxylating)
VRFGSRGEGVVAGLPVVEMLAERLDVGGKLELVVTDGTRVSRGDTLAHLAARMHALLSIERIALNFLQRLSGIASLTAQFVAEVSGTKADILDTRKTTPGWRALEKYAVRCGGGVNHRSGLYDGILVKDNHIAWLASGDDPIDTAVRAARASTSADTTVEIEVDTLDQLDRALECRPDIILLDNFGLEELAEAVAMRDNRRPGVLLEASGGISLLRVAAVAATGVDRISVGALTHSAPALDIGLDFEKASRP